VCDKTLAGQPTLPGDTACFTSPVDLLKQDLDVVFVCLTNDVAADVTIAGLVAGRHVFCEKPPGRSVADVERVAKVAAEHPTQKLQYGFNHRYHDSVKEALATLRSGELGKVVNMRGVYGKSKFISFGEHSDWRTKRAVAGGGILLDQGIHLLDLMRLFGGEFEDIHSFVSNDYWGHDVEDNAYALMRTPDGVVAMLHSTATQWRHRFNLEITLAKGALILSGILSGSKSYGAETLTIVWAGDDDQGDPREQTIRYNTDPSWAEEIDAFAGCIHEDRPVTDCSVDDACKTMALVASIYDADTTWRARWPD
jgi:predicted dehydrogenase